MRRFPPKVSCLLADGRDRGSRVAIRPSAAVSSTGPIKIVTAHGRLHTIPPTALGAQENFTASRIAGVASENYCEAHGRVL